jgi:hypothetical protein
MTEMSCAALLTVATLLMHIMSMHAFPGTALLMTAVFHARTALTAPAGTLARPIAMLHGFLLTIAFAVLLTAACRFAIDTADQH